MKCSSTLLQKQFVLILIFMGSLLFVLPGCSLKKIKKQTRLADDIGLIKGKIKVTSDQKGAVTVLRFRQLGAVPVRESSAITAENGDFQILSNSGKFHDRGIHRCQ